MATGAFLLTGGGAYIAASGTSDQWTDLGNFTTSLQNILARPGTFDSLFPETTDDGLLGLLQDGLAECHLEGTLIGYESDDNGLVRPVMSSGQVALVVLYAGLRLIRGELLNRATSAKYVAGPVSYEFTYATNVLRDIMRALEAQKKAVTALVTTASAGASFFMSDSYLANFYGYDGIGSVGLSQLLPSEGWLPALA